MKITRTLTMMAIIGGLLALAAPAEAQRRGGNRGGGNMGQGNRGNFNNGHSRFHNGGGVNFYFGGFGYPYYYGYPYYGFPAYGYPYGYGYGYGYPVNAYYRYDPRGVYEGRVANPERNNTNNDGGGKDVSMAARVQRELSAAGYYRGAIDGVIGDGTRRAIRSYERDNGLRVDGQIDNQLLSTMGLG